MGYLQFTKRVFNSPLLMYVNFKDDTFINLIELNKPYANGAKFALYECTKTPFNSNGFYKTFAAAKNAFDLAKMRAVRYTEIRNEGNTVNFRIEKYKDFYNLLDH